MTTIQGMKFIAAGKEREHPDHGGKHAKHTRSKSNNSLRQGNPQRASALAHSILTTPFAGIHSPE